MVFFTCDGCGETLKKNQVDAHASRCRNCYAVREIRFGFSELTCSGINLISLFFQQVSCVDCSISFYGGERHLLDIVVVDNSSDEETFDSRLADLAVGVSKLF